MQREDASAKAKQLQDFVVKELKISEHLYGFAYVGDVAPSKFTHLPYAISIGIRLTPSVVDDIKDGPNQVYYDEYLAINDKLDGITQRIKDYIEKNGQIAYAIASSKRTDLVNISGEFPHKIAAVRAGLGWIGKSALLLTKQYGPRIRLSTVLTDMPLSVDVKSIQNRCGSCTRCVDFCPAGAIVGNLWNENLAREALIDVKKCDLWKISHYSQFNGQVCGICVAVCPHGKKKESS